MARPAASIPPAIPDMRSATAVSTERFQNPMSSGFAEQNGIRKMRMQMVKAMTAADIVQAISKGKCALNIKAEASQRTFTDASIK